MFDSELLAEGLVFIQGSSITTLRNSVFTVGQTCQAVVEQSWTTSHSGGVSEIRVEGLLHLPSAHSSWNSQVDTISEGLINAAGNKITLQKFINNGVLLNPGYIVFRQLQSQMNEKFQFQPDQREVLIKLLGGELLQNVPTFVETIRGSRGRYVIPSGIIVHAGHMRLDRDFSLIVDGILIAEEVLLIGGNIEVNDGEIQVDTLVWASGTMFSSTSNINRTEPHVACNNRIAIRPGFGSRILRNAHLANKERMEVYDSALLVLQNGALLLNEGALKLQHSSMIDSYDDTSFIINDGSMSLCGGESTSSARVGCAIRNNGTIKVVSGTAEFGKDRPTYLSQYSGQFEVSLGSAAKFIGGRHIFEGPCQLTSEGIIQVSSSATEITIEKGSGSMAMSWLDISSGVIRLQRQMEIPIPQVSLTGGNFYIENRCTFKTLKMHSGQMTIRSEVFVGQLLLDGGTLASDKRQSRITFSEVHWKTGRIFTSPAKRFYVDVELFSIIYGSDKSIENNVIFTMKGPVVFIASVPIRLLFGAAIISKSTLIVLAGEVVKSDTPSESLTNDNKIEIGFDPTTPSYAKFSAFLQNNGIIEATNARIVFGNDGNLGPGGVYLYHDSVLVVEAGSVIIPATALETHADIFIEGGNVILPSGIFNQSTNFHVTRGQLQMVSDPDEDEHEVVFDGRIFIDGGQLNVTGEAYIIGIVLFYSGVVTGPGSLTIDEAGQFSVLYGDLVSDQREMRIALFTSETSLVIYSPLKVWSPSVFRVAENSTTEFQHFGSMDGTGTLLNLGMLNAHVNPLHQCKVSLKLHNYWKIDSTQGSLLIYGYSTIHTFLYETSQITENLITLGSNVQSGGLLDGVVIQGNVGIWEPTYIDGSPDHPAVWIGGTFYKSGFVCDYNTFRTYNGLVESPCTEQYVLIQGELLIPKTDMDRIIATYAEIVNIGKISWTGGSIKLGRTTLISRGRFVANSTKSGLEMLRHDSRYATNVRNDGTFEVVGPNVNMRTTLTNTGVTSVTANSHLTLEGFRQNGARAQCVGKDAYLTSTYHTAVVDGGTFEWRGTIQGNLQMASGDFFPKGELKMKGNLQLTSRSKTTFSVHASDTFDSIDIQGSATFDGYLYVEWMPGYTPGPGEVFQIVKWTGSRYGAFDAVLSTPPGIVVSLQYESYNLNLVVSA